MLTAVSGAVLCGGLNTRMHGRTKSHLPLGRQTFLQRLTQTLQSVCTETSIITRNPEEYSSCNLPVHTDIFSLRCSLSGIHAALSYSPCKHVFITACDTPLLMPGVIRLLMDKGSKADDVVVPVINGYYEPLCAIYSQSCLPLLSRLLENRQAKISGMYSRVRVHMVQEAEVRTVDPHLDSFINVNTPEDLFSLQKR